jgi:hypothetical protein
MQNYNYPNGVIETPTTTSYSNLDAYGDNGAVERIIAPRLVNSVPHLFVLFNSSGHKFAQPVKKVSRNKKDRYLTSDQLCKN